MSKHSLRLDKIALKIAPQLPVVIWKEDDTGLTLFNNPSGLELPLVCTRTALNEINATHIIITYGAAYNGE